MEFHDCKSKDLIGGHTYGPFLVLYRTKPTFFIQRGNIVERGNSGSVGWAAVPGPNATPRATFETTPEEMAAKMEKDDLVGWFRPLWIT